VKQKALPINNKSAVYMLAITTAIGVCTINSMANAEEQANITHEFSLGEITVEAKRPDWESKLSPGSVTVIRPDDYKGEQKSLPDLLKDVPGVHVREVNGKGQYTTVTVRGSTAAQVGIFIDGVLANLGGDAAVDISTIPVKNVERIEVYRGYIPSRFAGTFMGGVINIVTKKPSGTQISAEMGKSSYGGAKGALEIISPLGNGSIMVGANYESSDGDFKYQNYAAERKVPEVQKSLNGFQASVDNFNINMVDTLTSSSGSSGSVIAITDSQKKYYQENTDAWLSFVRGTGENSLSGAIAENAYNVASKAKMNTFKNTMIEMGIKDKYIAAGYPETSSSPTKMDWWSAAYEDWTDHGSLEGIIDDNTKKNIINKYVSDSTPAIVDYWKQAADPEKSESLASDKKKVQELNEKLKALNDAERYRKYNDYQNSSAIIKWQNDNWMVKGAWNKIYRHMPDSLWGDSANDAMDSALVDYKDIYYASSRRQKLENSELLLQNRNNIGKLEWGWMVDYLHQDKNYRTEKILDPDNFRFQNIPLREWSQYKSDKYNGQVDGTYKIDDRQMLDFQMNYSHERLNIDGSLMDKVLGDNVIGNILGQTRNRYDQDLLNIQIQDSITLDAKRTWLLTPSIRYNQSTITGYSDGKRFSENQGNKFHWIHEKDEQTDGKATWQLALKKELNDNFTMRMTGGTYYRLLNMYEIAGDGAGILPASRDGSISMFPLPEEGKQFDVSAIWNGRLLGADSTATMTYFWRQSDNMLQLVRAGLDYWSYFNDNRGKVHGVEMQTGFKWNKYDLDIKATYTNMFLERKNSAVDYGYSKVWATYQPEWEGNLRLTYHPDKRLMIFGEAHYTDEYFTSYNKDNRGGEYAYLSGKPVESLVVINGGIKWNIKKNLLLTFGCNDIFNKGPEQKVRSNTAYTVPGYINVEFPLQGRTYYATIKYEF